MQVSLDDSGFRRNIRTAEGNLRAARDTTTLDSGRRVHANLLRDWPRDTNRSVRGFAMAHRQIGVPGVTVPPLRKSMYTEENLRRLQNSVRKAASAVNKWAHYEELYRKNDRTHQKYYRTILREIRFHEKRHRRATQELFRFARALEEGGTPIVIGQGRKK